MTRLSVAALVAAALALVLLALASPVAATAAAAAPEPIKVKHGTCRQLSFAPLPNFRPAPQCSALSRPWLTLSALLLLLVPSLPPPPQ